MTHRKLRKTDLAVMPRLAVRKDAIGELGEAGTARFLTYGKLRKTDLAVLPRSVARKATIGEPGEAGTARCRMRF